MLFTSPFFHATDGNGKPLAGGVVRFYEPETTTPKAVYADAFYQTSIGSEVTLDAAGRALIFLSGPYKVRLFDADDVEIETVDNINITESSVSAAGLLNASFEESNGIPGWTITETGTGRVERVTDESYSGSACIRITSDGSGGGQLESSYAPASPGRRYRVSFAIKSSSAEMHNTVQVRFYDSAKTLVSTSSAYDRNADNANAWEVVTSTVQPPPSARYATLRVVGAQSDGAAGVMHVDDFVFDEVNDLFERNTPTGKIDMYGGESDPPGWMICDGRTINRGEYAALFAVIGEKFGAGDGISTFNIPGFPGRVPVGAGQGKIPGGDDLTDRDIGDKFGEESHLTTTDEMPSHDHWTVRSFESGTPATSGDDRPIATSRDKDTGSDYSLQVATSGDADASKTSSSGENQPHNNMQPSLVVNFIIKL